MHPDLKIKIPRMHKNSVGAGYAIPYWELVRKHGKSRKAMVDFICGIGRYSDRRSHFAIEFNIKAYNTDLSVEHLWELVCSDKVDCGPCDSWTPEKVLRANTLFCKAYAENVDYLWQWGCEDAYESWNDSDNCETFTGERIDWDHEIHGRSGGHLCMTKCAGINLRCTTEDLRDALMEKAHSGPNGWTYEHPLIRKLFIVCVQNSVYLTHRNICKEVEHRAADRLWVSFVEQQVEDVLKEEAEVAELTEGAKEILAILSHRSMGTVTTYPAQFKAICKRAGIPC